MASPSRPAALALAYPLVGLLLLVSCAAPTPAPRVEILAAAPRAPEALLQASAVNGCDPLTADASPGHEVRIEVGADAEARYHPRCLTVAVGDAVKFVGDLALHPLAGGAVIEGVPVLDQLSPLPYVNAGTDATFRADRAGVYPFYCRMHGTLGMSGVVYVR